MHHLLGSSAQHSLTKLASNSAPQEVSHRVTKGRHPSPTSTHKLIRVAPMACAQFRAEGLQPTQRRSRLDPDELPALDESNSSVSGTLCPYVAHRSASSFRLINLISGILTEMRKFIRMAVSPTVYNEVILFHLCSSSTRGTSPHMNRCFCQKHLELWLCRARTIVARQRQGVQSNHIPPKEKPNGEYLRRIEAACK